MADVEACELFVVGEIDDAAESVLHLVEGLTTETGHGEHERFDIGRQFREVDRDRFIVAIALAGEVIAALTDRPVLAGELAKPDDVDDVARSVDSKAGSAENDAVLEIGRTSC